MKLTIVFAEALPLNMGFGAVIPFKFTFTDGISSITEATAFVDPIFAPDTPSSFKVQTDNDGNITHWIMSANIELASGFELLMNINGSTTFPLAADSTWDGQINRAPVYEQDTQVPGNWSDVVVDSQDNFDTPLPAALPLFAAGLGALGLLGWRRKKKAAAIAA